MRQKRPFRLVLESSILVWLAATSFLYGLLLATILPDPGSHEAADAILGAIVFSPLLLIELVGLAALIGLWRGWPAAGRLGVAWGILQCLVALPVVGGGGEVSPIMAVLALFAVAGLAAALGLTLGYGNLLPPARRA